MRLKIRFNPINSFRTHIKDKFAISTFAVSLFWFFSLFPGRVGSDAASAFRLINKGQSTDWWTSTYFWFLKITSLGGRLIWVTSLFLMVVFFNALKYLIWSLDINVRQKRKTLFFLVLTPFFGNFGMNISHDVFTTSGILILTGIALRMSLQPNRNDRKYTIPSLISAFYLSNSLTGIGIALIFSILIVLIHHQTRVAFIIFLVISGLFAISGIGVTKNAEVLKALPFLADVKCVIQHPESIFPTEQLEMLYKIADKEVWKTPRSCASVDEALQSFELTNFSNANFINLMKIWIGSVIKYPEIIIKTHLQRASVALPPPFFQGPPNMVPFDQSIPLGMNTNMALQSGPTVLHPSIDYYKYRITNKYHKLFEAIALFPGFIINQASWFWGWGGLWLWPISYYFILRARIKDLRSKILVLSPILTNHMILIAVGPIASPRYVMSTIIAGIIALHLLALEKFDSKDI